MQAATLIRFFHEEWLKRVRCALGRGSSVMLLGLLAAPATAAAPKPQAPRPELRLSLQDLGLSGFSTAFLNAGISVLTVHFVDSDHLLVTFNMRGLIPRLADEPEDDQDQVVAAQLIAVPSGAVLARTTWHLHDHGRYLWSLGHGRFLLRIRDSLSTFSPMANLSTGRPFERVFLPSRRGNIVGVDVSPDSRMLTIETEPQRPVVVSTAGAAGSTSTGTAAGTAAPQRPAAILLQNSPPKPDVRIDVYRLSGDGTAQQPVVATRAASLLSTEAVRLPMDGDGYLDAAEKPRNHWSVAFYGFGGKPLPLQAVDSSCPPALSMVSRSQYVSVTCRGLQGSLTLAAFDLENHYIWEEPLGALSANPFFAFAGAAGRFAVSSRAAAQASTSDAPDSPPTTQDMRVYQTQTGDLLLRLKCDPVFQTPDNFDLASDGMRVAVVRAGAVEVYRLPELTRGDREDLAQLQKVTPAETSARVDLRRLLNEEERDAREAAAEAAAREPKAPDAAAGTSATTNNKAPAPVAAQTVFVGDVPTERKPPTLLNPGEKPDFTRKDNSPK